LVVNASGVVNDRSVVRSIGTEIWFALSIAGIVGEAVTRMKYVQIIVAFTMASAAIGILHAAPDSLVTFRDVALRLVEARPMLAPLERNEVRLDAVVANMRSAVEAEARMRSAGMHARGGQNQRLLGEADAMRGNIAFGQGEVTRIADDIRGQVAELTAAIARADALRTLDCGVGIDAGGCGGRALGKSYQGARDELIAGTQRAVRHADEAQRSADQLAGRAPSGMSIRTSGPGPTMAGK
jgi:hypothetical protein